MVIGDINLPEKMQFISSIKSIVCVFLFGLLSTDLAISSNCLFLQIDIPTNKYSEIIIELCLLANLSY